MGMWKFNLKMKEESLLQLRLSKFSEHVLTTRKAVAGKFRGSGESPARFVRIFSTDVDATDSSSDEDGENIMRRVKRHVQEIEIKPPASVYGCDSSPPAKVARRRRGCSGERVRRADGDPVTTEAYFDGESSKAASPVSILPDGEVTPFDFLSYFSGDDSLGFDVAPLNLTATDVCCPRRDSGEYEDFNDFDCFEAVDFPLDVGGW